MTISNFSITDKIKEHSNIIVPIFSGILVILGLYGIVYSIISIVNKSGVNTDEFAKTIMVNNYPELICTADSGNFRIYKENGYQLESNEEHGYVVWFKNETQSDGNTFSLTRCELSDKYKTTTK